MSRINNIPSQNEIRTRHFFTIDEANRALVLVRRIVADIVGNYGRLVDLQETIEAAQIIGEQDRSDQAQSELSQLAKRLQQYAGELDDVGVELKDWSVGIVDFPAMLDGHEAYLCWRAGEERVEHWHRLDEETSQRVPLGELVAERAAQL